MGSSSAIILLLTFGAVASMVLGVISIVADLKSGGTARVRRRLDDTMRSNIRERAKKSPLFKDSGQIAQVIAGQAGAALSVHQRLDAMVEQAGMGITSNAVLAISFVAGLSAAVLGYLLIPLLVVPPLGFALGALVPLLYVKHRGTARSQKLLAQLPEAFDLMGRVIRAGQTISQGLKAVADEFQPPISVEFAFCFEQQNLGISSETSLRDLARRTGLLELKIMVVGIVVQEQTGGNLAEMLDNLSTIIRERDKIRGAINTLTAEGRMQAILLLGLPPGIYLLMLTMNPTYALELFKHPILILVTLVSEGLGWLWIRSIVNFQV